MCVSEGGNDSVTYVLQRESVQADTTLYSGKSSCDLPISYSRELALF